MLYFVQSYKYPDELSAKTREGIYKRAKSYRWMGDGIMKLLQGGNTVVVSRRADRQEIAINTHQGMRHFGVQRVLDRLQNDYWWRNMGDLVVSVTKACHPCPRVKAGFWESTKEL